MQCTLEGSVQCVGVHTKDNIFLTTKIGQSETTRSHMFNTSLKFDPPQITHSKMPSKKTHSNIPSKGKSTEKCIIRVKFFKLIIKMDQSETTKSHMFNTTLKLINHI